jgi:hypothetical protein
MTGQGLFLLLGRLDLRFLLCFRLGFRLFCLFDKSALFVTGARIALSPSVVCSTTSGAHRSVQS